MKQNDIDGALVDGAGSCAAGVVTQSLKRAARLKRRAQAGT